MLYAQIQSRAEILDVHNSQTEGRVRRKRYKIAFNALRPSDAYMRQ